MRSFKISSAVATLGLLALIFVPVGQAATPGDTVVVRQGEVELTLDEIDAYADGIPAAERGAVFDSPKRIEGILQGLLTKEELMREARALGLDEDSRVVARMRHAANTVLVQARMDKLREKVAENAPDFSLLAEERYAANPNQFVAPASIDVRHILIGTRQRSDDEALALARKVLLEASSDPSSFATLVEKYSDDPSKAKNHGLIENAGSGDLVPEFRAAANTLQKVGDLSEPVKTQYGYHILKLAAKHPEHRRSFEEVESELAGKLREQYISEKIRLHVDQIRNTPLEVPNPDLIAALRTRYMPDAGDDSGAQGKSASQTDSSGANPKPTASQN